MHPILWYAILALLIVLITVLSLYLCYSITSEVFDKPEVVPEQYNKLNRYRFEQSDLEDLTSIDKDLTSYSRVSFFNEVEPQFTTPPPKPRRLSLLPDIHETSSTYSVEDIMSEINGERRGSELSRRYSLVTEGMRKNSLALPRKFSLRPDSNDTLDCMDPTAIEVKRDIAVIEEDARKIDNEIEYFIGGKSLKYYELHEKLIRLNLALSEVECTGEELRRMKKEVQVYIAECKEKLNKRV